MFLTLAAMLCGAPATIAALVLLPWSVAVVIYGMSERPGLASANLILVVAAVFALGSYWLLAARTIKGLSFNLGWPFRTACVAALVSTAAVFDAMPLFAALVVVVPVLGASVWFLCRQRNLRVERNGT
jgi:hypothetical protein